ncbi:DUF3800 domain-containing protein [Mycobacteroides abscessus]|uniref:DUF3800 domain-containing protein n=1 Tax=Mycobacteroides abscessus TaxID=36809 RepID=UPI0005DF1A93|nr:DUF3800 domain-containing protein [Mycobacteroides abscessus]MBE5435447.1 hypothetical protein [Mycobacteroides abscessus]MDM1896468.1 DUF3800 domain-containing protein [Mycobacteroides abscessus]MDM1903500.1 DUF3800 domain-containing protein [Mycobacteroides abscessus]MDM1907213.1 DUF3800 domain-containing protein [Mycobacteroides abscessus]MDM1910271.1 DUF3800 domain-containing protein [Mycobacteroides abscessus]
MSAAAAHALYVLLAYVDESGNTGDPNKGGTLTYTLGCVLVHIDGWNTAFDAIVDFRRRVRARFGVHLRPEIKANYLIRGSGDLSRYDLSPSQRHLIYRAHLRVLDGIGVRAFAVVINKGSRFTTPAACFDMAWETLLQRLERTSAKECEQFLVIHDEGENDAIRRWVRKARRHLTAGSAYTPGATRSNPAERLIDDPVPRRSDQSYLLQAADLVAYAGFRAAIPPSARVALVCPEAMWSELGGAIHKPVAALKPRSQPGIVLRSL